MRLDLLEGSSSFDQGTLRMSLWICSFVRVATIDAMIKDSFMVAIVLPMIVLHSLGVSGIDRDLGVMVVSLQAIWRIRTSCLFGIGCFQDRAVTPHIFGPEAVQPEVCINHTFCDNVYDLHLPGFALYVILRLARVWFHVLRTSLSQ